MAILKYDPTDWLLSAVRSIISVVDGASPIDISSNQRVYNVIDEFPAAGQIFRMPLDRTIIHFEVDDISPTVIGFGDNILQATFDNDPDFPAPDGSIRPYENACYEINFDVGVWATDQSGGVTARLNAIQLLHELFKPGAARSRFEDLTGGIQIRSWDGGRNAQDSIGDMDVYRHIGATLVVKVYSTTQGVDETEVTEIIQGEREIDVNGVVIIDL